MGSGRFQAVVIGASAGGSTALQKILPALPADFPLPVIIVQHVHPHQKGAALIYVGSSFLKVKDGDEKEAIQPGFVYFAPPNYHLLVENDRTLSLSIDPKVHFARPSVDVLFESAADAYGQSLIGIILSGGNQDGAAGLLRIKQRGGLTIVQKPDEAEMRLMPEAAIATAKPEYILPADQIGRLLIKLAAQTQHEVANAG